MQNATGSQRKPVEKIWSAIAAVGVIVSLYWSAGHPLAGGIASGVLAGTMLAFANLMRVPAPRAALGLAGSAIVTALAQGWIQPAALTPGAWAAGTVLVLWLVLERIGLGMVNREHIAGVTDLGGPGTAGRALIVYHSVGGKFQPAVERGLAKGLQYQGWRVFMTTASVATPTELSAYQLLVLGVPVFATKPARAILRYLDRLGDLHNLPILLVVSGHAATEYGLALLRKRVTAANGRIVDAVEVWTDRDNAERYGVSDPAEALRQVGERLRVAA